jgi:hypothetical protein
VYPYPCAYGRTMFHVLSNQEDSNKKDCGYKMHPKWSTNHNILEPVLRRSFDYKNIVANHY